LGCAKQLREIDQTVEVNGKILVEKGFCAVSPGLQAFRNVLALRKRERGGVSRRKDGLVEHSWNKYALKAGNYLQ
jgi:hypothetical protein